MLCEREAIINEHFICSDCADKIIRVYDTQRILGISKLRCGLLYDENVKKAVWRFKYEGKAYIAYCLATFMTIGDDWQIDCVVPVPLHKKREKKRGYNQSMYLAERICEKYELPLNTNLLTRVKDTTTQTDMTREERLANIKDAFRTTANVKGANILLIDDVVTTGSTLEECVKTLKRAGANEVYALTACTRATQR
ncbi:MAG: ComF family protein [Clostridia bacterium]|nr:ComF family protein [Clostridia bacterium]